MKFVIFCLIISLTAGTLYFRDAELSARFVLEYSRYLSTNIKSAALNEIYGKIKDFVPSFISRYSGFQSREEPARCAECRLIISIILELKRSGYSNEEIGIIAIETCIEMNFFHPDVCVGFQKLNFGALMFIFENNESLTPEQICGTVYQADGCIVNEPLPDWSVDIDENGPPIIGHKGETPNTGPNDLVIVQITDLHYDPNYLEGGNAECGLPACCRRSQGPPNSILATAGRWGDYRDCDSPWEAIQDMLFQIKNQHENIDYIYFTGDIIDHGTWETTFPEIHQSILKTFTAFQQIFPNIPIYSILGNHEAQPTNLFAPRSVNDRDISAQWLYDLSANEWSKWLPDSTRETIVKEGYYTVLVRPNFRIIVINNNPCFTYNFWIFYDPTHLKEQLQWLHDTLLMAEITNEKVHILAHIPSGRGTCYKIWGREYTRIVNRFWNTISAQFNGHTHRDQFNVYYGGENSEYAVNVAWNGGSGTAFSNVNPNYRVYYVDPVTYQVTDHETWIYNLTLANINRDENPAWFKEYSFQDAYEISNLSPEALENLLEEFAANHDKLFGYWQRNVKMGDTSLNRGCDHTCLASYLCEIATTEYKQFDRCNRLLEIFWENTDLK